MMTISSTTPSSEPDEDESPELSLESLKAGLDTLKAELAAHMKACTSGGSLIDRMIRLAEEGVQSGKQAVKGKHEAEEEVSGLLLMLRPRNLRTKTKKPDPDESRADEGAD